MENNWCIKLTEENKYDVISYLNEKRLKHLPKLTGFIGGWYGFNGYMFVANEDYAFDKELTFDEFKQMVAKENSTFLQGLENDTKEYGIAKPSLNTHLPNLDLKSKKVFDKTLSNLADLLKYKNEKYGNSVLEPLGIFKGKCKAGDRLDDKLSRIKTSNELRKNDVADLIGYLVLTCVENGWDSFDEFKD